MSQRRNKTYLVIFYQDMRAEAEQQVYERLNMKIEEFLELG